MHFVIVCKVLSQARAKLEEEMTKQFSDFDQWEVQRKFTTIIKAANNRYVVAKLIYVMYVVRNSLLYRQ